MYKAIFVDDETFIREQFVKRIKWNELGFELVGSFADGESALAYIKANHVDLAILDIKLPKMTGLDLCQYISKYSPHTSVIILSAYADFNYAIKGIEYGVVSYLTKPILTSELAGEIKKVKVQLDEAKHKSNLFLMPLNAGDFTAVGYTKTNLYTKSLNLEAMYVSLIGVRFSDVIYREAEFVEKLFVHLDKIKNPIVCIRQNEEKNIDVLICSPDDFSHLLKDAESNIALDFSCETQQKQYSFGIDTINLEKDKIFSKKDSNKIIESAKEYISMHYSEHISLENVATHVYVSPNYLSVLFKTVAGLNFSEYLLNYRIEKAKELLKYSSHKISDICKMVGYSDVNHFYKIFRKITGHSPNKYRKE